MKSFSRIGLILGATVGLVGASVAACGGSGDQGGSGGFSAGGSAGTRASQSNGTSTQSSNPSGGGQGEGGFNPAGPGSGTSTASHSGGGPSCGGTASTAEPIPLDIYIMLDKSGSMNDTSGTATKWSEVSQALDGFFADPASQGIEVGIQFFPLPKANLPAGCTTNAQCDAANAGPCVLKACEGAAPQLVACTTATDCTGGTGPCAALFRCTADATPGDVYFCTAAGQGCQAPNGNIGTCAAFDAQHPSVCAKPDYCTVSEYATPAREIGALDAAQVSALQAAVAAESPAGATPTSAALSGAISHAAAWGTSHPTHTVIVVFATDGLPTECAPTDIPSIATIASDGASGSPSVKTYVIGVLSDNDINNQQADQKVQQIADAGGGQAFIINSSNANVETQFVAAMNAIRSAKLACEYAVPPPPDGGVQDYDKVNVEYTAPGDTMPQTIGYVETAGNCDPTLGGWYYDVDPAHGGTPTKIIMCPATCDAFMTGGKVEIRVGCKTKNQPPPH